MKKVLFAAFAGLCVASSLMGTTAVKTKHAVTLSALDTVPKPDSPKFAQLMDTVPKPDSPKYAMILDTVPKHDTSKFVSVTNYAMDIKNYSFLYQSINQDLTSVFSSRT